MRFNLAAAALAILTLLPASSVAHADALEDDLAGLSDKQLEDTVEFSFGNGLFFLFHETGHMLISEFGFPVLGREEDAADMLSTLLLLEMDDPMFDKVLADAVEGWRMSSEAGEDPELWDTHSLDQQRAFNMVCMMVGKDRKRFAKVAGELDMPEERQEECADEYAKTHESWFGLLKKKTRKIAKESVFKISYQPPETKDLAGYADMVKASSLLEIIEKVASIYRLPSGIRLTAAECGDSNAYWSSEDRELTYCYELSQWYAQSKAATYQDAGEENVAVGNSKRQ